MSEELHLSRRERQIMDILYAEGEATVNRIYELLPEPPAHTAIRTFMKILEDKGLAKRRKEGREFIYSPKTARQRAGRSALRRVLDTFFGGSLEEAVSAHLTDRRSKPDKEELERIALLIQDACEKEK